jgi:hypothetical protein
VNDLLADTLPSPLEVHRQLGAALREVKLLRGLLRLSERAAEYRKLRKRDPRPGPQGGGPTHAA